MTKKQLIIKFFQENKIGFAYTTDGVNDYPALFDTETGEEIFNLNELAYFDCDDWDSMDDECNDNDQ